jgi:hypothetical protein
MEHLGGNALIIRGVGGGVLNPAAPAGLQSGRNNEEGKEACFEHHAIEPVHREARLNWAAWTETDDASFAISQGSEISQTLV